MVEACECGTFAVGRCAECREPVCGRHSAMHDEQLLCREHAAEAWAGMRLYLWMTAAAVILIALVAFVSSLLRA